MIAHGYKMCASLDASRDFITLTLVIPTIATDFSSFHTYRPREKICCLSK